MLKGDGHIIITANGRIVQIKHTQVSDTGRYTCVATNIAGEDEKDFDVNIQGEQGFTSLCCLVVRTFTTRLLSTKHNKNTEILR